MTLTACPECSKEVSSSADICPHCGYRLRAPEKKAGCGSIVAVVILGAIILVTFGGLLSERSLPPRPPKTEAEKKHDEAVNRAAIGARLLKKSAHDPDRFTLESALVIDGTGAVCYTFRAPNAFGAIRRGHAVLAQDGRKFLTESDAGFTAMWNRECARKLGQEVGTAIRWFAL